MGRSSSWTLSGLDALTSIDARRALLPVQVDRRSPYRIENGRIITEACEISVTETCNQSCRACSHLSPVAAAHNVSPTEVSSDCAALAKYYRAEHVRIVGGEPLLHPHLVDVIEAIRGSGITERIRVLTNGTILHKMPRNFWQAVDEIHISVYPGVSLDTSLLDTYRSMAIENRVNLALVRFQRFRETYSEIGSSDSELARRIYQSCQIAHLWRCHTVSRGHFFMCPQSLYIPMVLHGGFSPAAVANGLPIHDDSAFGAELLDYLESAEPLPACSYCLGSVGRVLHHEQVSRDSWRGYQSRHTEEMLDRDYLAELEICPDAHNGCYEQLEEENCTPPGFSCPAQENLLENGDSPKQDK